MNGFFCFGLIPAIVMYCQAPSPSVTTVTVCPVTVQRSPDFQRAAADELRQLPRDAKLRAVASEWINLRDQTRKCREPR